MQGTAFYSTHRDRLEKEAISPSQDEEHGGGQGGILVEILVLTGGVIFFTLDRFLI